MTGIVVEKGIDPNTDMGMIGRHTAKPNELYYVPKRDAERDMREETDYSLVIYHPNGAFNMKFVYKFFLKRELCRCRVKDGSDAGEVIQLYVSFWDTTSVTLYSHTCTGTEDYSAEQAYERILEYFKSH